MVFWLRSEERRVAARGRRVRDDLSALRDAGHGFATGLRHELGRPKVLLAFFAAGLGYGWLRRGNEQPSPRRDDADVSEQTGRLAKVTAAVVAGARIYDLLKRAAAFVDQQGYAGPPSPGAAHPDSRSAVSRQYASDEAEQHEADYRYPARE